MAAAELLQEFLVSVRYGVDTASQRSFLDGLKRAATSVSGIAAELVGLAGAITAMAEKMAAAGEKLYYMSQRLGESVQQIEAASYAMSTLGESAAGATASMEAFGRFQRTYGPGATAFLRHMGVTAAAGTQQMLQLGEAFRRLGGYVGNEGSRGYAIAMQYASMLGISEQTMRAISDPAFAGRMRERQGLAGRIFGGGGGQNTQGQVQAYASSARDLMNTFRQFGSVMDLLYEKFGLDFFGRFNESLQRLYKVVLAHLPQIVSAIDAFAGVLNSVVAVVPELIDSFSKLEPATRQLMEGIAALGVAMMASPFGWFLATMGAVLLLLDDYYAYTHHGVSAINWSFMKGFGGDLDAVAKSINGMRDGFNAWFGSITGVHGAALNLIDALGVLVAGKMLMNIGKVAGAIRGIGSAATFTAGKASMLAGGLGLALLAWAAYDVYSRIGKPFDPKDLAPDSPLRRGLPGKDAPHVEGGKPFSWWNPSTWFGLGGKGVLGQDSVQQALDPFGVKFGNLDSNTAAGGDTLGGGGPTDPYVHGGMGEGGSTGGVGGYTGGEATGGGGPVDPKQAGANAIRLRDKIMAVLGVPVNVAAGIVSNIMAESGGVADIYSKMAPGHTGGYGLMQWAGSRKRAFFAWAAANHMDPASEDTQIAYMKLELGSKFPGLLNRMRSESGEQGAGTFFDVAESGGAASLMRYRSGHMSWGRSLDTSEARAAGATPTAMQSGSMTTSKPEINHNVSIAVSAPDAHAAGVAVLGHQQRAHEDLLHKLKGWLL